MRRWSWVVAIMLVVSLVLAGCGKKDAAAIVKELDGKVSKLDSYHGKGVMTLRTGMEPQEYLVEVCYQAPHYYRISMKNAKKDITQIVLRNDDGVFVLTPHLNKSFRFQSDWPENQGQVYLYQSLVQSIVMDQERQFVEDENAYVFDVVANYQNGSLARQKIWLDKKTYEPQHVEVSDSNANVLMEVKFDEFEFGTKFEKDQFDMQRNMTSWHIQSLPTMGQELGGQAAGEHGHSGLAAGTGEATGETAQGTSGTAAKGAGSGTAADAGTSGTAAESVGAATAGNGAGAGKEGTGAASGTAAEGAGSGTAAGAGADAGKEGTGVASGTAAEGAGSGAAADAGASAGKEGTGTASGTAAEGSGTTSGTAAGSGTASDAGQNGSGDTAGTANGSPGASSDATNGAKGDSAAQGTAGASAQSNPGGSPSAKPQSFGVIEPRYIPSGVKKQDVTDVKLGEEMGVMIRYSGDYNFTLVESRPTTQAVSVLPAEPVDLGFTWGVLAGDEKKTLMWTNDGVEFRLSTADLELTEMIKIAQSVEGESGK